ncbi:hypothetical protein NON00_15020 [Roseomonas sp. GC11]|uniref:hypothetical protein n=1 Tax=Roseomonas sp. GC11 TaxID=2950546 RepID=UPI00210AABAC|nr:hypothetical protein [Roseomonas sp. GC11]MCQ4161234.1 hypothetical protein [Roseomonas sp. GC11]
MEKRRREKFRDEASDTNAPDRTKAATAESMYIQSPCESCLIAKIDLEQGRLSILDLYTRDDTII